MNNYKVDYHIHTTASDGKSRPRDIVRKAKDLDYDIIAITDHDNVDGIEEACIAGEALGIRVIPGIEIAVSTEEGIGLHILGYNIDPGNRELADFLETIIENRHKRNEELFAALRDMGYDIYEEDIAVGKNHFIGKPLIARALKRKGYIENEKQAFSRDILGSHRCREVKRLKPLASETIEVILKAGGTPVLAHPIQTRHIGRPGSMEYFVNIEDIIKRLKKQGLKGLECYHPDQNEEESAKFVELAEKYHLHISRGSDFHGDDFAEADKTAEYR